MILEKNEEISLQLLIAGDQKGFTAIYDLYNRAIFQFVLKFVHSNPLAEDLTQEVFIKIWESRSRLQNVQSFKSYLFVTARNHTLNRLKDIFRSELALGEVVKSFIDLRSVTEEEILDKEYLEFLNRTLATLPERTRYIFRQCREHGRTYEEVAAELKISRNAIKNHMVHAMKVLSSSVTKELGVSLSVFLCVVFNK